MQGVLAAAAHPKDRLAAILQRLGGDVIVGKVGGAVQLPASTAALSRPVVTADYR
jgi:hypothetical protein